jgi:hypothetical protein
MNAKRLAAALARAYATPESIERLLLVWRHPMRAEAKITWFLLYFDLAEGRAATVNLSPAEAGAFQGHGDAAGRRSLETLIEHGFVVRRKRPTSRSELARAGSVWTIELRDPLVAAKARPAGECEAQAELFDVAELGEEAEILTIDGPRSGEHFGSGAASEMPLDLRRDLRALKTLDFRLSSVQKSKSSGAQGDDGSGAASEMVGGNEPGGVSTRMIGQALGGVLRNLPTPSEQLDEIKRLSAWLYGEVGDARLYRDTCDQLAVAIVEGRWELRHVHRVLAAVGRAYAGQTKNGVPKVPKCVYFSRAAFESIRENDPRGR